MPTLSDAEIEHLPEEALYALAESPETDSATIDLIAKYFLTTEPLLKKIVQHPNVLPTTISYIRLFVAPAFLADLGFAPRSIAPLENEVEEEQQERTRLVEQLKVPEKIKLAMKGNKDARTILIRDANRLVMMAVLENPRLTDEEVEKVAQSKNLPEEVLRAVARNAAWIRRYPVVEALANNPKTPLSLSIGFLKSLRGKDLERLSKNKGIPAALRNTATKMLVVKRG
jgi:hypothetical protein